MAANSASATTPIIQEGTLNAPLTVNVPTRKPGLHQLLIENTDSTQSFTVQINGSLQTDGVTAGVKTLLPGTRMGLVLAQGLNVVVLTPVAGAPTFSLLIA